MITTRMAFGTGPLPVLIGFVLLAWPLAGVALAADCTPDIIFINGRVHTVDPSRPEAEAFAICGERISHVGTTAQIRALAANRTRVIDLEGRRVVPGFNDAHVHFIDGADELVGVNLRPATDERDFARRLGEHASKLAAGKWILGGYWDHESWPSKALPTRQTIDSVTPNHPVFVQRLDGHMGLANSLAMKLAGITRDTASPDGGTIVRDANGEPTGIFKDNAMALVMKAVPPPSLDDVMEKARAALKHAAEHGVTTVQDMTASATELAAYQALRERGELTARISSVQNHGIDGLVRAGIKTGFGDDWIRIGGIKLFADGSMGSGTAAFFDPYTDDPSTTGLLLQSPEELQKAMIDADAAGFQLVVHAIGDRANAITIDAMEQVARVNGARDRRPRIEHAQVVRDADKKRMARLGIIASIQPSHCIDDMRWAERRIGKNRCAIAYDFRSFVDAGVKVAFGTDWYVEPLDPMLGLYAAVTRQFPDGTPAGGWFPEEKITMSQAVEFYTLGSAYAEHAEATKGSIAPGKLADIVVLSEDIFTIPSRQILQTRPVLTMVGGRIVFGSETLETRSSR
jgi:predicted amidohydrolase YtcJ